MTAPIERIADLQQASGYTPREATFLWLVAEHSGYFVARQFDLFHGTQPGRSRDAFLKRLLANRHGCARVYARGLALYHVCSRPLYMQLGQPDNRNRRPRPPQLIRARLMALDFVLRHPLHCYLPYGEERAAWLANEHGVAPDSLPAKAYYAAGRTARTLRHFVDKFPAFVSDQAAAQKAASFCYIDPGEASSQGWETYLRQYRSLFLSLPCFEVVYVAATDRHVSRSEQCFRRLLGGSDGPQGQSVNGAHLEQLLVFFPLRAAHERRDYAGLSREQLTTLQAGLRRFRGAPIEHLYQLWRQGGRDALLSAAVRDEDGCGSPLVGRFSSCVLPFNYTPFAGAPERCG